MASKYQENERAKAVDLIKSGNKVFYGAKAGKKFRGNNRDFVLYDSLKNIYQPIVKDVVDYFDKNIISWWGGKNPTGHVLSSQIAYLNHLFQIRNDKLAVLKILENISPDFIDVFQIDTDKFLPAYIQFEAVSDNDYLNEGQPTRGSNCTSIDALIYAKHKNGEKWLIPIEWKYTEFYNDADKSIEDSDKKSVGHVKGDEAKGIERLNRYCYNTKGRLIDDSKYLKTVEQYRNSVYFFEPFYQLMRQTLWAEQMIKNKNRETLKADNFINLHVIPENNEDLLKKVYKCSGLDMEKTWRNQLIDQSKYRIISPELLLNGIDSKKYNDLLVYLKTRYQ
ncbi:MAG: hypothetical protein KA076_08680 [Candidatus Marinimicrobia bacterium]|jgi:hypothetical protein|nr:hypothetical protein [Candidatus Neomarinimicrobiota bacterium]